MQDLFNSGVRPYDFFDKNEDELTEKEKEYKNLLKLDEQLDKFYEKAIPKDIRSLITKGYISDIVNFIPL